jgi:hypothetical protein
MKKNERKETSDSGGNTRNKSAAMSFLSWTGGRVSTAAEGFVLIRITEFVFDLQQPKLTLSERIPLKLCKC